MAESTITITFNAPELTEAILQLARAIGRQTATAAAELPKTMEAPAVVPVAEAPVYTLDQISRAGAALIDAGKMDQLLALLHDCYNIQAITQLKPEQYGSFATELRALGAQI